MRATFHKKNGVLVLVIRDRAELETLAQMVNQYYWASDKPQGPFLLGINTTDEDMPPGHVQKIVNGEAEKIIKMLEDHGIHGSDYTPQNPSA